jgi:glycerol kinase
MPAPLILAIDQGTSSTKALLVDAAGAVAARGTAPLGESHPRTGWVEQDPAAIWDSVRAAVAACLDGQDPHRVAAVGFSTQRESLLMWDRRTGAALSPLISWQDQRTGPVCEALRTPETEALVRRRSGLPLDPMFSAAKAKWLLDTLDPDRIRAKAGEICLGTIDAWLLSRFGGDAVTEAGNASRTQLLDVRRAVWDPELLALFRVPEAALPRVVSSTGPFPATRGLGPLPDGVPVKAVLGDSHAALFAHGAFVPGQIKATTGTGSSVMGLVDNADALDPGLCLTIAWSVGGPALAAEGNIRAAGSTLRWVADLLGLSTQDLADLAAKASSDGVFLVPGFNGLGAPWWDVNAVGLLAGFSLGTGRAAVARAALESIPHQIADVVEAIDRSVGRVHALHVDGGPTRNPVLMQLLADLAGCEVLRSDTAELSALGAAHLAGLGAGLWSWDDLKALPRAQDGFAPTMAADRRQAARNGWRQAVRRASGAMPPEAAGDATPPETAGR